MFGPPSPPLNQGPDWWYESWGLSDWLGTLFDTPLEVHAFLLGAFTGLAIALLTVRQGERTTFSLVLVVFLFTFGVLESTVLCSPSFTGCEHVRYKPWYFLGGFLAAYLGSETLKTRYTSYDISGESAEAAGPNRDPVNSIGTMIAGVTVLVLLGVAMYSMVSPTPVQPITGLATLGGFFGSLLGLAAFYWARGDPDDERTFADSLSWVYRNPEDSLLIISYGTVLGFGYPRIFWELGSMGGSSEYLLGSIIWAQNGLPSVLGYVFVLFVVATLLFWVYIRRRGSGRLGGNRFAAVVLGFATYAFCLFVLSGYAGMVWFRLLPAA